MHDRENCDGVWLDAEEHREGEPANLRPTNVIRPRRVKSRVSANTGPASLDLAKKLEPESTLLEFVPEELHLQFELSAPTDA
jgi:hypothetical protein